LLENFFGKIFFYIAHAGTLTIMTLPTLSLFCIWNLVSDFLPIGTLLVNPPLANFPDGTYESAGLAS
tara:strand:+ start:174 stop:374 length:201 start_codon:yes stop_codon:yes gene_type:complete